jgi:hypothetical protein
LLTIRATDARPMATSLSRVLSAPQVFIGTYIGPATSSGTPAYKTKSHWVTVERVLRGTLKKGRQQVARGEHGAPHLQKGERFIGFIDKKGGLHWAARKLSNRARSRRLRGISKSVPIERAPLMVQGFYDFNAYLVSPALLSLSMLERLLEKKKVTYRFSGNLYFRAPKGGQPTASTIKIDIAMDDAVAGGKSAAARPPFVSGMPKLVGFPKPKVTVTPGWNPTVTLSYRRSWPRPLVIYGMVTGLSASGVFETKFNVGEPHLRLKRSFSRYIANKNLSHSYVVYRLMCFGFRKPWRLEIGRELGKAGKLWPPAGLPYKITETSLSPKRFIKAKLGQKKLRLKLHESRKTIAKIGPYGLRLYDELLAGPLRVTLYHSGNVPLGCKLSYEKTRFKRR